MLIGKDKDLKVSRSKLESMLEKGIANNGVIFDKNEISQMAHLLISECNLLHLNNTESIQQLFKDHGDLGDCFSKNLVNWLIPSKPVSKKLVDQWQWLKVFQCKYITNHKKDYFFSLSLVFLVLFVMGQRISVFADLKDIKGNPCYELIFARATGSAINFLTACLLLLMTRPLITLLRMSQLSQYLPVDHHVQYHKALGILLFVLALIHSALHLFNIEKNFQMNNYQGFLRANGLMKNDSLLGPNTNLSYAEWLLTSKPGVNGLIPGWANPTGCLLILVSLIMILGAHSKIR